MEPFDHIDRLRRLSLTLFLIALVALTTGLQFASCTVMGRWQHWLRASQIDNVVKIHAWHNYSKNLTPGKRGMPREVEGKIAALDFVKGTSSKLSCLLWTTTCKCTCGDLDGLEPESNFSVRPWLENASGASLGPREIWVGTALGLRPGDTVSIAGQAFTVSGLIDEPYSPYSCYVRLDAIYNLAQTSDEEWKKCLAHVIDRIDHVDIQLKSEGEGGVSEDEAIRRLSSAFPDLVFKRNPDLTGKWTPHLYAMVIAARVFSCLLWPGALLCFVAVLTRFKRADPSEGSGMKIFRGAYIALIGSGLGIGVAVTLKDLMGLKAYRLPYPRGTHFIRTGTLITILAVVLALVSIAISNRLSRRSGGEEATDG